jgi:signal transduction histidine kinase
LVAISAAAWRHWAPDGLVALSVLFFGLAEGLVSGDVASDPGASVVLVLGSATAVGLARRAPGPALGLLWGLGIFQLASGMPVMLAELTVVAVLFGTARWGQPATIALGGLSVPLALLITYGLYQAQLLHSGVLSQSFLAALYYRGALTQVGLLLTLLLLVVIPWPAGLALRFSVRARASRASMLAAQAAAAGAREETEQAQQIARLREQQTQFAHDVHDVVGHSLAVILAQAESAQYLHDSGKLKQTMETIAASARSSLRDVRQVLSDNQDAPAPAGAPPGLGSLITGLRASGHEVTDRQTGTPLPLPPEIGVVAYRVLQEMLTNALRHGRRGHPVRVQRHWPAPGETDVAAGALRIEVSNMMQQPAPDAATVPPGGGRGLAGMRRRLESAGGRLEVRRLDEPAGTAFTVTAWLPVRGSGR